MNYTAKRLLIPVLALACLAAVLLGGWMTVSTGLTSGRYLRSDNGSHIVIDDRGSPIVMRDLSGGGALFDSLETGDRVLVLHDAVAEVYPARSGAYWCLRLDRGNAADLPADTLEQLTELGWLSASSL